MKNLLIAIVLALILGLCFYKIFGSNQEKIAFVFNQRVFAAFRGKIDLEKKLSALKAQSTKRLDSLSKVAIGERGELEYQEEKSKINLMVNELSQTYTADVWKRINEYVSSYGEEQGYDFIIGATGDGNLMYARKARDVTDEVIEYINLKYEGNK